MDIVGLIMMGIGISVLGKAVIGPGGRDDIGLVTTAVCGIVGVLVGWYATAGLGTAAAVEVVRLAIALLFGSAFATVAALVTGRSLSGRL
jgi:hypothetical protein